MSDTDRHPARRVTALLSSLLKGLGVLLLLCLMTTLSCPVSAQAQQPPRTARGETATPPPSAADLEAAGPLTPTKGYSKLKIKGRNGGARVQLELPPGWRRLEPAAARRVALTDPPPLAVYAAPSDQAHIIVSQAREEFAARDAELLKRFSRAKIEALYQRVTFHQEALIDGPATGAGGRAVQFAYTGELPDRNKTVSKRYTAIRYALAPARQVYVVQFTCDERLRPRFQEASARALGSVRVQ